MTVADIGKKIGEHTLTFAAVLAVLWGVGRPAAQEFIHDTVNNRIERLERSVGDVQQDLTAQSQSQVRVESELQSLKSLQAESRSDIKAILRGVRGLRAE